MRGVAHILGQSATLSQPNLKLVGHGRWMRRNDDMSFTHNPTCSRSMFVCSKSRGRLWVDCSEPELATPAALKGPCARAPRESRWPQSVAEGGRNARRVRWRMSGQGASRRSISRVRRRIVMFGKKPRLFCMSNETEWVQTLGATTTVKSSPSLACLEPWNRLA